MYMATSTMMMPRKPEYQNKYSTFSLKTKINKLYSYAVALTYKVLPMKLQKKL